MKILAFFVLGFLAYSNTFSSPLILDDNVYIRDNPNIREIWPQEKELEAWQKPNMIQNQIRPLLRLTLALNYKFGELNVTSYHVVNLVIHILASLALFKLVEITLLLSHYKNSAPSRASHIAFVIALIWLVHPLQTESVTYIYQRSESLMGLFYLLTLFWGAKSFQSPNRIWIFLAIASCYLGSISKAVIVSAPLMVILYDRLFLFSSYGLQFKKRFKLYLGLASSWLISGSIVLLNAQNLRHGKEEPLYTTWEYARTQFEVISHYLKLSLWPQGLCINYEWPVAPIESILIPAHLILFLFSLTIWLYTKKSGWAFLGFLFFFTLAPTSSFFPLVNIAFEHRMYLALASVVTLIVIGGDLLLKNQKLKCLLSILIIASLSVTTFNRNKDYESILSLWQDTVIKSPHNYRGHNEVGLAYMELGNFPQAIQHFQKSIENNYINDKAYTNLASIFRKIGNLPESIKYHKLATKINPNSAVNRFNFALACIDQGNLEKALSLLRGAHTLDPANKKIFRRYQEVAQAISQKK